MPDSAYEDIITGNYTRPDQFGLAEDPFDDYGNPKQQFAVPEPFLERGEAPRPIIAPPAYDWENSFTTGGSNATPLMQNSEAPPSLIVAASREDDLGRLRPDLPSQSPSWGEEAQVNQGGLEIPDAFNQPPPAPGASGNGGQMPSGNGGQVAQPGAAAPPANGSQPQPVTLDQWVRNQYGERLRQATGQPGADTAIVNAQGQSISAPIADAQGNVVGQQQRPLPQLHKGTLAAIWERADAAVKPIPPGNWTREQLYSFNLHRQDKVAALAQQMQADEQRRQLHAQDRRDRADEQRRREAAQAGEHQRQEKAKSEEAEHKAALAKQARQEVSEKQLRDEIRHHHGLIEKESNAKNELNEPLYPSGQPLPEGKEYLQNTDTRLAEAVRRARLVHGLLHGQGDGQGVGNAGGGSVANQPGNAPPAPRPKAEAITAEDLAAPARSVKPERVKELLGVVGRGLDQMPTYPSQAQSLNGMPLPGDLRLRLESLQGILRAADSRGHMTIAERREYEDTHRAVHQQLLKHGGAGRLRLLGEGK